MFFERGAFSQEMVDEMIADGHIPIYRDPEHPEGRATIVKPDTPRQAVWAHPSMAMYEIAALWHLRTR